MRLDFVAGKLDQLVALRAVQVIVLRVAVVVFVNAPAAERHLPQQAGFDEFGQRPVDRRPADLLRADEFAQLGQQIVGVEMLVPGKHLLDDDPPLLRDPLPFALQIFFQTLHGRQGDFDGPERIIVTHTGGRVSGVALRAK